MHTSGLLTWRMARSTALLALAVIAPLAAYAVVTGYVDLARRQTEMAEQSVNVAQALAQDVDRLILSTLDDAEALSEAPSTDAAAGHGDIGLFQEAASRARRRHANWLGVMLTRPDGSLVFDTEGGRDVPNGLAPDMPSLLKAANTGRPAIGAIVQNAGGEWGIPLRAPVTRFGKVHYVVTVILRADALDTVLANLRLPRGWLVAAINADNRVVAGLPKAERLVGANVRPETLAVRVRGDGGVYRVRAFDGLEIQSFYWSSPVTHWSAHVAVPRTLYEAPLRHMLLTTLAGFGVCMLLALALVVVWVRDFEARRAQAMAVEQVTRVDALGRLTGGVAHDFNNLLTVIQGNTEILNRKLQVAAHSGEPGAVRAAAQAERPLSAIRMASDRAAKLTRQLLVFARGGAAEPTPLDLRGMILDLMGSLSQVVGPGVAIETDLATGLPAVSVDPLQFEAALLNLAANARDAMEGGGVLELRLQPHDDGVTLSLRDHGPGFDPAVLARVFEPFFTTKPVGQGTGLGLSQVYGLVKGAGGRVTARNAPGGGAVVAMSFPPSAARPRQPRQDSPVAPPPLDQATQAEILLVDDNDAVRTTTAAFLREYGLSVVEACDVAQALGELETRRFAAVLSDIAMPGELDGTHLAQRIRQHWPNLPVLLVSGFSERAAEAQSRGFTVVAKPYSLLELEQRLRQLMAQGRMSA